MVASVI